MIKLPLEDRFAEVGAMAYIIPSIDPPEMAIDTWDLNGPLPELYDLDFIADSIEVSRKLVALIEANPDYVPDGWDGEDVYYFFCALLDGIAAYEAAFPAFEALEEAAEIFEGILDALVDDGLLNVASMVPVAEVVEPPEENT